MSPCCSEAWVPPEGDVRLCPQVPRSLAACRGNAGRAPRSLRAPASRAVTQPSPPVILRGVCGNRREFQDRVLTRTNLPSSCLAAGPGVSPGPGEMGGCVRVQEGGARVHRRQASRPALLRAPNRSLSGSPGPHPGHRGGSAGDILDTGFLQPALARSSWGWWPTSCPSSQGHGWLMSFCRAPPWLAPPSLLRCP